MPPNSIVAIVNEQYHSCCQSMKVGHGDLPGKIATSMLLGVSQFGSFRQLIRNTFWVWFSKGVDNVPVGDKNHYSWYIASE